MFTFLNLGMDLHFFFKFLVNGVVVSAVFKIYSAGTASGAAGGGVATALTFSAVFSGDVYNNKMKGIKTSITSVC